MKVLALCLIVLLATSNCMSIYDKYPLNFSPKRSIMTLLTQVEEMMKNGGPLDAITKMLNEFESQIKQEQYSHDNLWAEQQASCATEIEIRETAVKEADSAIADDGTRLQSCLQQEHRAKEDYEITSRQLIENKNQLGALTLQRRQEEATFQAVSNTYDQTKQSIGIANQILNEIWEGNKPAASGFLQLAKHMNKLVGHTTVLRSTHLLNGVMSALAQITTNQLQIDEALFERVKTMLQNFLERQTKNFEAAYAQNEAAIAEFNRASGILNQLISHLTTQSQELDVELKKLATCIVVQTGNQGSADAKKKRNTELLEAAKSLCAAAHDEYFSSKAQRNEELDLLGQIKDRVKARFAQLSSGVTARGELDADQFKHTNDYSYQKPEFKPSTGL